MLSDHIESTNHMPSKSVIAFNSISCFQYLKWNDLSWNEREMSVSTIFLYCEVMMYSTRMISVYFNGVRRYLESGALSTYRPQVLGCTLQYEQANLLWEHIDSALILVFRGRKTQKSPLSH